MGARRGISDQDDLNSIVTRNTVSQWTFISHAKTKCTATILAGSHICTIKWKHTMSIINPINANKGY